MRFGERNDRPASMIGRVALVLGAFRPEDQSVGVSELARRTRLAKATTFRICAELVEHGFLERTEGAFRLGIRLFELGEQANRPHDLRKMAIAHMTDLRSATRQTVHLAVLDGTEVVYVLILRSRTAPPLASRVGGRLPAHATGVGKALLAYSPADTVAHVIASGLVRLGPRTITDPALLLAELAKVRHDGVAYEHEESGTGVACAASPVLAADGNPIAALSVTTSSGEADLLRLGPAVRTAALALGREAVRRA